jgi:hypothetical protein
MSAADKPEREPDPDFERYRRLIRRLPITLRPSMNQQVDQFSGLFPFEQARLSRMLDGLASLTPAALAALIAPVRAVENKMGVASWDFTESEDTIENASLLARSPYYAEWRSRVQEFYEAANVSPPVPGDRETGATRLMLTILPASLPTDPQTVWRQWDRRGRAMTISGDATRILPLLVAGESGHGIAGVLQSQGSIDPSGLWLIDAGADRGAIPRQSSRGNAFILDYDALKPLRTEFLAELNKAPKNIEITDEVRAGLRRKSWEGLWPDDLAGQPRLQRFVIELFLSGNGALIFPNSFVEWTASEVLRRARPRAVIARFGMRIKPKPFTSIAIFENQQKVSSVPDTDDPQGSATDSAILARYLWLAASRYPEFEDSCSVCIAESANSAYIVPQRGEAGRWGTRETVEPEELCDWIKTQLAS